MSDHRNGMKKQGRDQMPLHGQQKFNDDKQDRKRTSQKPGKTQPDVPTREQDDDPPAAPN
jgi:hypothetical protein